MAQRISRAKKTLQGNRFQQPGDLAVVLKVLYLVYNAGHAGRVDLAAEAIRLTRHLAAASAEPEVRGLLALMLLHHARLPARSDSAGALVPLDEQDRTRWDATEIAEGVAVLQSALAQGRRGPYQLQAAIAALHDDAPTAAETDWPQVLEWYDELMALSDDPAAALSRAVAVGHARSPVEGLLAVDEVAPRLRDSHRVDAVRAYLLALDGDAGAAADLYARAAARCPSVAERDHLVRRAALLRTGRSHRGR
jgi:predicted RNA polymerase sigma factor